MSWKRDFSLFLLFAHFHKSFIHLLKWGSAFTGIPCMLAHPSAIRRLLTSFNILSPKKTHKNAFSPLFPAASTTHWIISQLHSSMTQIWQKSTNAEFMQNPSFSGITEQVRSDLGMSVWSNLNSENIFNADTLLKNFQHFLYSFSWQFRAFRLGT